MLMSEINIYEFVSYLWFKYWRILIEKLIHSWSEWIFLILKSIKLYLTVKNRKIMNYIVLSYLWLRLRRSRAKTSPKIFKLRPNWPEKRNKSRPKSQCKSPTCIFHNSIKLPGVRFNCVIWRNQYTFSVCVTIATNW